MWDGWCNGIGVQWEGIASCGATFDSVLEQHWLQDHIGSNYLTHCTESAASGVSWSIVNHLQGLGELDLLLGIEWRFWEVSCHHLLPVAHTAVTTLNKIAQLTIAMKIIDSDKPGPLPPLPYSMCKISQKGMVLTPACGQFWSLRVHVQRQFNCSIVQLFNHSIIQSFNHSSLTRPH